MFSKVLEDIAGQSHFCSREMSRVFVLLFAMSHEDLEVKLDSLFVELMTGQ